MNRESTENQKEPQIENKEIMGAEKRGNKLSFTVHRNSKN